MIDEPSRRALLAGTAGLISGATAWREQAPVGDTAARGNASILDWGVRGDNDPNDGERIQRAFDEAPLGGNLYFPAGDFRTRQPLRLRRQLNLIGSGGTRLGGDFDERSDFTLLEVNIEDVANRDNRNQRLQGLRLSIVTGRGDALAIRNRAPNIANIGLILENNLLSGPSVGPGHALRLEGVGTHHVTIRNSQIIDGVFVGTADGITIEECLIWGEKPGVTLDLVPGAFQTRILRNAIVARDGALRIINGSQVYFEHNQVEQPPSRNRSPDGAHVSIAPRAYGARHIRIRSNNFGAGDNTRHAIHVAGDCQDLLIDDNVFSPPSTRTDVVLADPLVGWTRIGPNNSARQRSSAVREVVNAGLLQVEDRGTGTFGVARPGVALAPASDWRPSSGFRFWKELDGQVRFDGDWTAGAAGSGTRIGNLPPGFRPRSVARLQLVGTTGEVALVEARPDGAIVLLRGAGGPVSWSGTGFAAAPRPGYPASDP